MSAFLFRLGRSSARHPFRVLGLWLVAAVAVVALQGSAGGQFDNSERVPGVESQHAADVLNDRFPSQGGQSARIVLHTDDGPPRRRRPRADRRAGPRPARRRARRRRRHRPVRARRPPRVSADGQTAYLDVTYALDKLDRHPARRRHGRHRRTLAPAACRSSSPVRSRSSRRRPRAAS